MKEILKLDHIQKYYGNGGNVTKAIQDISFSVQEGEFVGIMGASVPARPPCSTVFPPLTRPVPGVSCWTGKTSRKYPPVNWRVSAGNGWALFFRILTSLIP